MTSVVPFVLARAPCVLHGGGRAISHKIFSDCGGWSGLVDFDDNVKLNQTTSSRAVVNGLLGCQGLSILFRSTPQAALRL